ncbi:sodium/glucose cotransporter 2 isoform X2 [Acipenser oxyrinchus oxyrinchus]|uniref:Sodium/glucose cotransporter 2 isoform X2 n=1 Tax=Acipenser oxyrinchus oxyrinchus TaxID=40147 RepID=A0AAD8CID6_ACIOX|nr:sodium/glucose cotransporter 2 isoform X2 [Acipenser oxyrinchus oxyrinchus]
MRQARRAAAEKSIVGNVLEVQEVSLPKPNPVWRCIGWFCGMGSSQDPEPSEEEVAEASKQLPDISEDPFWKNVVNTNAIIMMVVAVFLWGYYA